MSFQDEVAALRASLMAKGFTVLPTCARCDGQFPPDSFTLRDGQAVCIGCAAEMAADAARKDHPHP